MPSILGFYTANLATFEVPSRKIPMTSIVQRETRDSGREEIESARPYLSGRKKKENQKRESDTVNNFARTVHGRKDTYVIVHGLEDSLGLKQQACHFPDSHLKVHLGELEQPYSNNQHPVRHRFQRVSSTSLLMR